MSSPKRYSITGDIVVQLCKNTKSTLEDFEPVIIKGEIHWYRKITNK